MAFLHPALLLLLPLAAIPIILHLITVRRLPTTELATFRFLFDSYLRQHNRLTFMSALLTALRTLFLLLLILLMGRPILQRWGALFGAGGGETVFLMDCSASMNARTDGVAALDRAKTAALAVAERLGGGERLSIVRVTGQPEELVTRLRPDESAVRAAVDGLAVAPGRANLRAALARALENADRRRTVYVFTDGQANTWQGGPAEEWERLVPAGARLTVVNVGAQQTVPNRAVIGEAPARGRVIVGWPVVLRARVANFSSTDWSDAVVKAFLNEQEVARATVSLKAGEQRVVELPYVPAEAGTFRGRFEIGPDRFPDDDTYLFVLTVAPSVPVVLVNGRMADDPADNEGLYLRAALTARTSEYGEWARALEVREIAESALTAEAVRDASVVVLANCGAITPERGAVLRAFVAGGGGLIMFAGDLVPTVVYNKQFFPTPGPQADSLTGADLDFPVGDERKPGPVERLGTLDFQHPIWNVFADPAVKHFATVRFYTHIPLKAASGRVLATWSGGAPALVENRYRRGTVLLAGFPANARWSNLPLKPEFVPLVLRMVNYAQRPPAVIAPAVASAEGVTEFAVAPEWGAATGTITDEAGRSQLLTFQRSDGRWVGAWEAPGTKGYYRVDLRGGAGQVGETVVAANVAPGESDFAAITERELRERWPAARVQVVDATAEAQQLYGTIGEQNEVWRVLIVILFLIIGVEFVLATWRSGRRQAEVPA